MHVIMNNNIFVCESATFVELFWGIFFFLIFVFIGCVVCLQPTQVRSSYLHHIWMEDVKKG